MSSESLPPLAPSNPTAANEPTSAQLAAQVKALTTIVEANLLNSKTANVGNKKKRGTSDENEDPAQPACQATYRSYGRNLVRTIGPFERIHTIVEYGVTKALAESDDEREETLRDKRLNHSWCIIKDTIPGFGEEMIGLAGQRRLRKHVCSEVQEGLRGARGDDSNSLKHAIGNYVSLPALATPDVAEDADAPPPPPPPPKFNSHTKVDRGYNNPYSARLNTPVKHPATEETYAKIRNGEIQVSGTEMPYFMYRDGYVYNGEDREDGLLEGSTMFAVAKHIYQGPTTALKEDGYTRGKAGNAALNGVTTLTARDIGYVGVQTRFALSSQQNWGHMDGNFSYPDFYWSIVELLKGEEGQEIIDRFNMKVFGTTSSDKRSTAPTCIGPSDFEVLEAQRAAKRARKIADATAAAVV